MNRNTGSTASILALVALLFGKGFVSTGHEPKAPGPASVLRQTRANVKGDGPWNASCEYWAPARAAIDPSFEAENGAPPSAEERKSKCGNDRVGRWGLPGTEVKPDIKALIAVVPDPGRTNMALQFDRTIDALMAAAGDNGYLSSYYWLPWKEQSRAEEPREGEGEERDTVPHEPGVIILKYAATTHSNGQESVPPEHFNKVIYVFLVGETPTTGIDGFQIQKAFKYQDDLAGANIKFGRSTGNASDTLAIIGPTFTGSAASLRQAIDSMLATHGDRKSPLYIRSVDVTGVSATNFAANQLSKNDATQPIQYRSFAYDAGFDQQRLLELFCRSSSPSNPIRVAFLVEDGTTFGNQPIKNLKPDNSASSDDESKRIEKCRSDRETGTDTLFIRFPREVSLLRNAQAGSDQGPREQPEAAGAPPSPYLRFTLKDSNTYDSVPHLSRGNTPLSQEAQLMTIARQLLRYNAQFIVVSGSNVLDAIFLGQFLHRACPDARLVFYVGDLLFEREVDNVPFIGSLTVTPYPLFSSGTTGGSPWRRAYPDSNSQAYFNAASFTFWEDRSRNGEQRTGESFPMLAGYRNMLTRSQIWQDPPLWVTAIGSDGYYPLGMAGTHAHGGGQSPILPEMPVQPQHTKFPVSPGQAWSFLCVLSIAFSLLHIMSICGADIWSPFTRELAISHNDQPRRRAMYINIATAMLFCMAFVLFLPSFAISCVIQADRASQLLSWATVFAGTVAAAITLGKIRNYIGWAKVATEPKVAGLLHQQHLYFFFNVIAWATMVCVPLLWSYLCFHNSGGWLSRDTSKVGLFFSYRCVHAWSGLSPLIPVLLLLFTWYLWAFFSTWRLRFSDNNRPMLPGRLNHGTTYTLFVADEDLSACSDTARDPCLYKNMTCLLITREVLARFVKPAMRFGPRGERVFDGLIILGYLLAFALFVLFIPVRSLDTLFWATGGLPTPYEFLVTALFFPLLFISIAAWLRLILVWSSLRRGLLQRLENYPIRHAFSRLAGSGWTAMLRHGGMHEQWRDMARSAESMRQMVNDSDLEEYIGKNGRAEPSDCNGGGRVLSWAARRAAVGRWLRWGWISETITEPSVVKCQANPLRVINNRLHLYIGAIQRHRSGDSPRPALLRAARYQSNRSDVPVRDNDVDVVLMQAIGRMYAAFSELLLERVLLPYWTSKRSRLVQSAERELGPEEKHPEEDGKEPQSNLGSDPAYIRVAEEFLAIRYLALIRVVLANMRYLLLFVSTSFVLAIVAWNSYPFQPRQFIDEVFTCMLAILGGGIILVLAQMHRDPILSRITRTKPNELGIEFYIRIIAFGAVPVLTWFAYQFPGVGSAIFKFLQPGIEVVK